MEENQNQENQVEEKKPNETLRNVLIAVLLCAFFVAVISLGVWQTNLNKPEDPGYTRPHTADPGITRPVTQPETKPTTTPVTEPETDPVTEPATEPPETAPPVKTYSSGKYKVGVDIPAGEYFLQSAPGRSGYMCISSDSNGDDILKNENFNTHHYITIQDGQYLKLNRATALSVNDMTKTFDASNLDEGMYRVGIDIPAGEYRLTAAHGNGYVCVYDNSSAYRDIQSNNNFETNDYVTVANGQYLLIHRCTGSIVQ